MNRTTYICSDCDWKERHEDEGYAKWRAIAHEARSGHTTIIEKVK